MWRFGGWGGRVGSSQVVFCFTLVSLESSFEGMPQRWVSLGPLEYVLLIVGNMLGIMQAYRTVSEVVSSGNNICWWTQIIFAPWAELGCFSMAWIRKEISVIWSVDWVEGIYRSEIYKSGDCLLLYSHNIHNILKPRIRAPNRDTLLIALIVPEIKIVFQYTFFCCQAARAK